MTRVGFSPLIAEAVWQGGANYFRNLLGALLELPDRRIDPVLFSSTSEPPPLAAELQGLEWAAPVSVRRFHPAWAARLALSSLSVRDRLLERDLGRLGIAVLSHSGHLGPGARIPTLAWMPDFQHLDMPQFFSSRERRARDRYLRGLSRFATRILLSSRHAQSILEKIDSAAAAKSRVLRFVANVPDASSLPSLRELQSRHRFSEPYFYLPNQFWRHKNHEVVVDALAILRRRQRGGVPLVLASGNPRDYRHPGHFEALLARASSAGVADRFRPLGIVSRTDLMALMWNAIAVINPSYYEGWSTTVEEAKSLGVPLILSDIPVHREQRPALATYFHPDDAEALATTIGRAPSESDGGARSRLAEEARSGLAERRAAFARCFESYVLECAALPC